jgi:hypothetical protein
MPGLPTHFGVIGTIGYYSQARDGSIDTQGGQMRFSVIANGAGHDADVDQIPLPLDGGPPVLSGLRVTGEFRGKPFYDGECTYVSNRPVPPILPVTKERYLRLVILGMRADSARHVAEYKKNPISNDPYADWVRDKPKRDAENKKTYDELKKTSPQAADALLAAFNQQEAAMAADSDQMRGGNARLKELQQGATDTMGATIQRMQSELDGLSAAERMRPVAIEQHGVNWDWHSDQLVDPSTEDAKPLVQINPAFYDKSLAPDVPQVIWVCIPGLQGLVDKSYENQAGDTYTTEKARTERRTHDATLIRDHLDWAALEALVKR